MNTATTHGISVHVSAHYQEGLGIAAVRAHLFAYKVTIHNSSQHTIQLLRRRWVIFDSSGEVRTIEGAGVVGELPIIRPNEKHTYMSGCDFKSTFGAMSGHFMVENKSTKEFLYIEIPRFLLEVPWRLN